MQFLKELFDTPTTALIIAFVAFCGIVVCVAQIALALAK